MLVSGMFTNVSQLLNYLSLMLVNRTRIWQMNKKVCLVFYHQDESGCETSFAGAILRIVKEVLECDPLCETYSVIVETEIVSFVLITQSVDGTCLS